MVYVEGKSTCMLVHVLLQSQWRVNWTLKLLDIALFTTTLQQMARLFPLTGGVLQDHLLAKQSLAALKAVVAPKVPGLLNLETLARMHPTKSVVAFSSIAALLGNAGQANYSSANAAMDAWMQEKQEHVRLQTYIVQLKGLPGHCMSCETLDADLISFPLRDL